MYTIKHLTKHRFVREGGRVILHAQVTYPCLAGEDEGVTLFNQTYETAAQGFLKQGIDAPCAHAQKEASERGCGFARYEVVCCMTAREEQVDEIKVNIDAQVGRKYGGVAMQTFADEHIWTFPRGYRRI